MPSAQVPGSDLVQRSGCNPKHPCFLTERSVSGASGGWGGLPPVVTFWFSTHCVSLLKIGLLVEPQVQYLHAMFVRSGFGRGSLKTRSTIPTRFGRNGKRAGARTRARRASRRAARIVPGFTRTAGFFGRFGPGRGELKFHDLDVDDATIASNGTITQDSVNKIAQGVTEVQRIGRKCILRSINWRFNIRLPEGVATTTTADTVRVLLYLDKQANGAAATVTNILETDNYQSFNNLANKSRFRTLMDRTYDMNTDLSGDGTTVDSPRFNINDTLFKNLAIPIEFDSTTGAITEIKSNNIGVLLLSKNGLCTFDSKMRVRFSDQ